MKKKNSQLLKSGHLLIIMIIVCVGLMIGTLTLPAVTAPVRTSVGFVVSPLQNGVNTVGKWLTKQFSGFHDVQKLTAENEALKKQVSDLTQENNQLVQNQGELTRLQDLYNLDKQYSDYTKIAAEVISKEPGSWYNSFVVNKGTKDGIAVDMNVLGQGGLIGIVTEVGGNWAQVRAIIDDNSSVSGMASNTSEPCVVNGSLLGMENGKIVFSGLRDTDNEVTEGTSIVTSNISDRYLTGLLIGYVSEIAMDSNNLTKSGTIIPAADFRSLREVLIITDLKQRKENESTD
ncbi:MAG: rod shape-determining protein MreC [Lachnospiraceae bacterium]|nr:rod shape-determining protein MreC [Lachnospiraceae bacterium]